MKKLLPKNLLQAVKTVTFSRFFATIAVVLFSLTGAFAQSGIIGADFSTGWTNPTNILQMSASAGTSRIIIRTPSAGTGNKYFRIVRNATTEMSPSAGCAAVDTDVSSSAGTQITAANTGPCGNGAWYINVTDATWRYVFKTPSDNATSFYWWAIQGTEQSVSSVYQNAVIAGSATTITANLSGALSTGQSVYLRYSTDNFATSSVVTMTGAASTYTGDVPSGANTAGATVRYYVFTGPSSGVAADGSNADLYTFNFNNNAGANYVYSVTSFGDSFNRATLSAGNNPSLTYTSTNTGTGSSSIATNFLQISNGGTAGRSYVTYPLSAISGFNTSLSSNTGQLTWTVNAKTNRTSLGGFSAASYAMAIVLASSNVDPLNASAQGYALALYSTNNWRLVKFSAGLGSNPTDVINGGSDMSAVTNYASIRVVYTPSTNTWQLYTRDDGASAWSDPSTGVATQRGSNTVDATYTATAMSVGGYFWNYSTAASQFAQFDNLKVSVAPIVAPTITSFVVSAPGSGTSGYVGNTVTVTGTGFTGVTVVKVGGAGGTTVTGTVVNDTTITFPAPAVSGTVYVQNSAGNATSGASYTNNGYITTQAGGWNTAATWLGGAVPPSATTTPITIAHNVTSTTATVNVGTLTVNSGVTLTNTAATTLIVNSASTNTGAIIANGTFATAATYTNSGTFTVGSGGTFQLNTGGFFTGTAIAYNATASTLAFNATAQYGVANGHAYWPTTNGPVTVSLVNGQGGAQLQTGTARTVTNLLLAANLDIIDANALTVNGTLTVNNGGSISNNPPVYGSAATLLYNGVTAYGVNNEWTGNATTAGAGTPQNVTLTTSTLNMPATSRSVAGNLLINSGSTLTLNGTIGADLNVSGNFTNSGTFASNSRAVQFRGAAAQTITGATTFTYLTINNSSTGVTLANNVVVSNQLDLTLGKLILGTTTLTISPAATIINAGLNSYVVTGGTGQMFRTVGNTNVAFPVGNSIYNPITFNNSGTSDVYGVREVDGAVPSAQDPLKTVSRRWIVTEAVSGGSNLSVVAQYNTGDVNTNYNAGTNPFIGFYNGSTWSQVAATLAGANPFTASSNANVSPTNLTTGTQYFAVGKDNAFFSVAANLVVTAITPTSPTAGSNFSVTVRSQDAYGLFTNVVAGTAFSLSTTNGFGAVIGGTTTGTITAGTSTVTVNNVTLSAAGTGATITATRTSGDVLAAGTSATFDVLAAASQLAFGTVSGGSTGANLASFIVEARRPDSSVDNTYTGNITISKASGPGVLSGTVTVAAVAGVATFSAAQFDAAGTYTLAAASGSLTGATSNSFVVTLAPVALGTYTFTGTACSVAALAPSAVVSNVTFSQASVTGETCNNNSAVSYSVGGASWGNTFTTGRYIEFTATPATGYGVNSSTLTFDILRTGAGATNATVRSSVDGYAADLITAFSVGTSSAAKSVTLGGVPFTQTGAVTFRIYGWGGNSTGDLRVDNITLNGNIVCIDPVLYAVTGGGTICSGSAGTAVGLANSQSGINYQLKLNGVNSGSPVAGNGSAISFGNQTAAGTYTVVATNTNGTCNLTQTMTGNAVVVINAATTWTGGTSTVWTNAANWSCGVPLATSDVTIGTGTFQPEIVSSPTINTLTINSGATVKIKSGFNLTVTDAMTNNGTLTIENNANLVQVNNVSNAGTGTAVVNRNSSAIFRQDYTLWSSPVSGQQLQAFSPMTLSNRFYTFTASSNTYTATTATDNFATGAGYLIRVANNWVPYVDGSSVAAAWPGVFTGTVHNGSVPVSISDAGPSDEAHRGFNAVGNPYPSAIKLDDVINDNSSNIEGTLWFWRKRNDTNNLTSYSTCTTVGCTVNNGHSYADADYISTGQGFIVKAQVGATSMNFTNTMRSATNVDQFFRVDPTDRFWLEVKNSANATFGINLVAYVPQATIAYDNGLDGLFLDDNQTALYSAAGDREVVIQARPTFEATDVLPLVFKTNVADTYTIGLQQFEGVFAADQDIFLKDNVTATVHNLKTAAYSFATAAGTFADRFEVIYQSPLATTGQVFTDSNVIVYKQNQDIVINTGNTEMAKVQVYDVRGRLLVEKDHVNANETRLNAGTVNQVLIVKITAQNGATVTKKVVN